MYIGKVEVASANTRVTHYVQKSICDTFNGFCEVTNIIIMNKFVRVREATLVIVQIESDYF